MTAWLWIALAALVVALVLVLLALRESYRLKRFLTMSVLAAGVCLVAVACNPTMAQIQAYSNCRAHYPANDGWCACKLYLGCSNPNCGTPTKPVC